MPDKVQTIAQLSEETSRSLSGNLDKWKRFLTTASRVYKYPYPDQLLIYAQRPDATACAGYDIWNNQMHRYIRKGSKGIALLDRSGNEQKLRYVFDVSDTVPGPRSRSPYQWELRPEHYEAVERALERQFFVQSGGYLVGQLEEISYRLASSFWEDHQQDLFRIIDGSALGEYDRDSIGAMFRSAATNSTIYALLSRCGLDPDSVYDNNPFLNIYDFDTTETLSILGTAVSENSEQILRQIEVTIKAYEREKRAERTESHERTDLHNERRLPDSRTDIERVESAPARQIRDAAEDLPSGTSSGAVQQHAPVGEAVSPSEGDRRISPEPAEPDDAGADEIRGDHGRNESPEPDGLDRPDEQLQSPGGGVDPAGAGVQLSEPGSRADQFSLFPSEEEQIAQISEAESAPEAPSAFSLSQADIDAILQGGSGMQNGKLRIYAMYQHNPDRQTAVAFLKDEYGLSGRSVTYLDGSHGFVDYSSKGARFSGYNPRWETSMSWIAIEKRLRQLIEEDRYLNRAEKFSYAAMEGLYAGYGGIPMPTPGHAFPLPADLVPDLTGSTQPEEAQAQDSSSFVDEVMAAAEQAEAAMGIEPYDRFSVREVEVFGQTKYAVWDDIREEYYHDEGGHSPAFDTPEEAETFRQSVQAEVDRQEAAEWEYVERVRNGPIEPIQETTTSEPPSPQQEYSTETVATYPSEQTHLPYDIIVERIHVEPERSEPGQSVPDLLSIEQLATEPLQETEPIIVPESVPVPSSPAVNFHITDMHLGEMGPKAKFRANMDAIYLLKALENQGRQATPEEQKILSRYVGWGGLADAFDSDKRDWIGEYNELVAALTPEEYEAARSSTLNAHYTSPTVIKAVYDALGNMGFKAGNILEPSMGVGNFFGMLPEEMRISRLYGVELDSISGRIAKQLYPQADITVAGFETTNRQDFYDVAVGNVPFGQYQVNDRAYNKLGFSIHNYFFAKALDQVRPGGVVAFVTSRYTMDAKSPEVRKYLAQRADLLGAIRLPNNAFRANAGTDVVSDIIFLQKRETPLDIEPDWVHLGENEDGFAINSYFIDHPEMILGQQASESTQYGRQDFTVLPTEGADLGEQLAEAVQYIGGQYTEAELPDLGEDQLSADTLPADPKVKNFSFTVVDGEPYYRENSVMVRPNLSSTAKERVKGLVSLRESINHLIDLQMDEMTPSSEIEQAQAELNHTYDNFTAKYGLINDRANRLAFSDDSSYYLLCSLEILDEDGRLERKADMFSKRTIKQQRSIDHVDTAVEALAVSIGEKAGVDLEFMASLMGGNEKIPQIVQDLQGIIFKDPNTGPFDLATGGEHWNQGWQTADEYLSGNVRQKLRIAQQHAEVDPDFIVNVRALEKAQPKDLDASEIEVRLGSTWVGKEYFQQFMYETFNTPWYLQRQIQVNYSPYTAEWQISGKSAPGGADVAAYSTYGTLYANAYRILEDTLNLRDTRIYDTVTDPDGKERRVLNVKETTLAAQKQQSIKDAFQDWVWKDPQRRQALVKQYNELMNSTRPREYDGSHLVFSGMNPEITLREHQKNAIAHVIYGGNTLLAHEVGAGKTFEMVAAAMESKRLGLCNKSIFVVPNHLTDQWAAEFLRLYPSANILVTTKKDFETRNRKKFCSRIATGDYDAVIIGHSQFEKIPISKERQERLLKAQIDEITEGIADLKYVRAEQFTVKQMEKAKKSLEARLQKLQAENRKDDVITFEQLGVDRMFVDESDSYKNLFLYTKMRNVAGLSTTDAQKSSDMYAKCRYMDELTGGRGVVFATGTPISNSMTELYTIQRYLQHDRLDQLGMSHFDCWASRFGETTTALELAPEGTGYRARTRFAKFFNLPELMNLFKEVADIKTADQLNLPVPQVEYHNISTKPTEIQKAMVQELSKRATKVHSGAVNPSVDNMLKITSDGRKLGLDQRIVNPELPDEEGTKVNQCVNNILHYWKDGEEQKLTQLVFCDLSTPKGKSSGKLAAKAASNLIDDPSIHSLLSDKESNSSDTPFTVYEDIRDKLVAGGIPREQIAFIHDADTEVKKRELFAKVRSGQVRVLIGSTQKMGAGTNVQDRLIALHDLDAPWRPRDLTQRKGRIERQGNMNETVHVCRYVTEGTFDAYLWQTLETKQRFISQIMTSKSPVRSCEDVDETALSFAEIKALCAGDPRIKERMDLDVDVSRLKLLKADHQSKQFRLEDMLLKTYPQKIEESRGFIRGFEQDLKRLEEHPLPKENFVGMEIRGDILTDKENAGAALLDAVNEIKDMNPVKIGSYRGFELEACIAAFGEYQLTLKGGMTHTIELGADPRGNLTRIENALDRIPDRLRAVQAQLENYMQQQAAAQEELGKPFPLEQELKEKSARLIELDMELNLDGRIEPQPEQIMEKTPRESVLAKLKSTSVQEGITSPAHVRRQERSL